MSNNDFTTAFTVDQSPEAVFAAINNVRAWRPGEIDGVTDELRAELTYRYKDVSRRTQTITEMVPGRRVAWRVVDLEIHFVKVTAEWNSAAVEFDITPRGGKTELRFTHKGRAPTLECCGGCSGAWGFYVGESLRSLITTGKGEPNSEA
jgi:hypothetical protein